MEVEALVARFGRNGCQGRVRRIKALVHASNTDPSEILGQARAGYYLSSAPAVRVDESPPELVLARYDGAEIAMPPLDVGIAETLVLVIRRLRNQPSPSLVKTPGASSPRVVVCET